MLWLALHRWIAAWLLSLLLGSAGVELIALSERRVAERPAAVAHSLEKRRCACAHCTEDCPGPPRCGCAQSERPPLSGGLVAFQPVPCHETPAIATGFMPSVLLLKSLPTASPAVLRTAADNPLLMRPTGDRPLPSRCEAPLSPPPESGRKLTLHTNFTARA